MSPQLDEHRPQVRLDGERVLEAGTDHDRHGGDAVESVVPNQSKNDFKRPV